MESLAFRTLIPGIPADARRFAEAWNASFPERPTTAEEWAAEQRMLPEGTRRAIESAWRGDDFVGVLWAGDEDWNEARDRIFVDALAMSGDDVPTLAELYARATDLALAWRPRRLSAWTRSDHPGRTGWLAGQGFVETARIPCSRLRLEEFDPDAWTDTLREVARQGVRIATIDELEREGRDWAADLHAATTEMIHDIPSDEPPSIVTLDHFRTMLENRIEYQYEWMAVAIEDDRIMAYSRIQISPADPALAFTGLTGTVRAARRRGLATALKAMLLTRMKAAGIREVETENHERNPMLDLNLRLGFRTRWNFVEVERVLQA